MKNLIQALETIFSMCCTEHVSCGPQEIADIASKALLSYHNNPQDSESEDIRDLYKKFSMMHFNTPGHLTHRKLVERIECMQEELNEFTEGVNEKDIEKQADALIDLVYFAKGTSIMMGLPWIHLWRDVQRANMTKVRGVGKRGHIVDLIKPPGWQGPRTYEILIAAGYNEDSVEPERDDIEQELADGEKPAKPEV